ncbi:MAG: MFS transporter [Methanomassiliicoccales archaeon]|nr:MFS transporter [Methanomassiliicoccales archaeon]
MLLIEIGQTFGTSVGMTNQMKSATSFLAIISGLTMGLLSVRFKHRTLLLTGLLLCIISTLGCYFAPTFIFLVVFFAIGGIAQTMILPMATALIGQHVPRDQRANALGYLMAGNALLYLIGMPYVNYLGDWRKAFLLFSLPLILISLLLSLLYIPRLETSPQRMDITAGYRGILSNRSAIACLIGHGLGVGVWGVPLSLSFSYFRQVFLISRSSVVYITYGTSLSYLVGALASSKIVPRLGRRKTTILSLGSLGVFTVLAFTGFSFWFCLVGALVTSFLGGLNASSSSGLNLEQIPRLRGPMMSMASVIGSVGNTMSLSIGGLLLIQYGWGIMGLVIGSLGPLGSIILYLYAAEPE